MLPIVAIAGRPNVGKSTLFNRLTRSRAALVADEPGLTRDRIYGVAGTGGERPYLLVDTGGLADDPDTLTRLVGLQAWQAIAESDVVLFVVDARAGLSGSDQEIAARLRRAGRPVVLVVNKVDGLAPEDAAAEFHDLGFADVSPISAAHGRGVRSLEETLLGHLPRAPAEGARTLPEGPRICLLGRPNVGKSTLVNRLLGAERVLAHDMPGTTRDSIHVPLRHAGRDYVLIDTAGVRRRARVGEGIEKFGVLKALGAVEHADVVVVLLDATEGVTEQDAHLVGLVLDTGRALVVAVNKWDRLDREARKALRTDLPRRLAFASFAPVHFVSALRGSGLGALMRRVDRAYEGATRKLATPELTRILAEAVQRTPPPTVRGRRIKLRYAHQGGLRPPRIVIHGNQTDALPDSYRRYLERCYREALGLEGTPVIVELRTGANPFAGRRNPLTPRQQRRRKRLLRHVKR